MRINPWLVVLFFTYVQYSKHGSYHSVLSPVTYPCWQRWQALTLPTWPKYCYNRWNQSQRWRVTVDWSSLILCFTLAQHVGLTLFTDALLMLWEGRCSAESPGQGVHPKLHTIQKLYTMYGIGYHLRCRRASWMDLRPQLLLLPLGKQPYWAYRHTATRGQPSPWSPLLVRDEALLAHSRPERHAAAVANSPLFQCFSPSSASTLF